MADVELVIKISEELYEANNKGLKAAELWDLRMAVKNGTLLPEGHGELIDRDALRTQYCEDNCGERKCVDFVADRCVFIDAVLEAPTIVEADKSDNT